MMRYVMMDIHDDHDPEILMLILTIIQMAMHGIGGEMWMSRQHYAAI